MDTRIKVRKWLMIIFLIVLPVCAIEIVWDAEVPISPVDDTASYLSGSRQRCVAVGADWRIHVVWSAQNPPYPELQWGVWHTWSLYGVHWSSSCISDPIYSPYGYLFNCYNSDPSIAIVNPGQLRVWWDGFTDNYSHEYAIYGTSPDNGGSWQYPEIPDVWEYWATEPPSGFNSLSSDGENCLLFYDQQWVPDFMEYRLLGGFSIDAGTTWERAPWLGWNTVEKSDFYPCTACDICDTGYVIWQSFDESNNTVIAFAKFYLDVAAGVQATTLVSYPGSGARGDAFIVSNLYEGLYVVWSDTRDGNGEVYFKKSTDRGVTWTVDTRLTTNSGNSTDPTLVVGEEGQIYVAWIDNRDGNTEVYFKYSEDNGATWSNDARLTNDPGICSKTHFAISPDELNLYIVWNDTRDGQEEVYFKRGTITVGIAESRAEKKEKYLVISPSVFKTKCLIKMQCNKKGSLQVYDLSGTLVRTLDTQPVVAWDGTDDTGRRLPAGIYFVRLVTGEGKLTSKIVLLK